MTNQSQMLTLSRAQMLALWKQVLRLDTPRRDCVVERDDGIDLDAWLMTIIDTWYARLLATAPVEWVPVEDVAAEVTLTLEPDGVVAAVPPVQAVRPVEWKLRGWKHSVTAFAAPDSLEAAVQRNPFTRGAVCNPAAVDHGNRLLLFSAPDANTPRLDVARCVVRPADGSFTLHQAALETIHLPDTDLP